MAPSEPFSQPPLIFHQCSMRHHTLCLPPRGATHSARAFAMLYGTGCDAQKRASVVQITIIVDN
jgi:hypothetical protein